MTDDHTISNSLLSRLAPFVGEWRWEASVGGQSIGSGPSIFEWLADGAFLMEHSGTESPEFPSATTIISGDDATENYCMLQVDSRSISRIYQMSLSDGVWKLWRYAPGFVQRFTGKFSSDGKTIRGSWEKSSDGAQWELDFDLMYTRIR